MTNLHQLTP